MITIRAQDGATPQLQGLIASLRSDVIRLALGRAASNLVKQHLIDYNNSHPNKSGFPRQNLYAAMARATSYQPTAEGVVVAIAHIATRLRYMGGTVRPGKNASRHSGKPTRYLTIPACAEAYGKRAGEYGNLTFRKINTAGVTGVGPFGISGKAVPALVEASASKVKIGKRGVKSAGFTGGRVYFWLIRKATFQAQSDMLPSDERFREVFADVIGKLASRKENRWR